MALGPSPHLRVQVVIGLGALKIVASTGGGVMSILLKDVVESSRSGLPGTDR